VILIGQSRSIDSASPRGSDGLFDAVAPRGFGIDQATVQVEDDGPGMRAVPASQAHGLAVQSKSTARCPILFGRIEADVEQVSRIHISDLRGMSPKHSVEPLAFLGGSHEFFAQPAGNHDWCP
jgi:hypothetical protein